MTSISSIPDKCLFEDVTISDLYQYVDSRQKIKENGLRLSAADSKVYYKLRHNCFKTKFLDLLGFPSTEEKPFNLFGIESNKTPDFFQQFGQFWVLIEFTVVKNIQSAIKNKKSWTKYDYEVELFRSRGEIVHCFYPTFVLNDVSSNAYNDIIEISELLDISFYSYPQTELNNLHESFNLLEYNISELMPELLLNEEVSTQVNFKSPKSFDGIDMVFHKVLNKVGVKRQRMQNIFNRIKKNSHSLEKDLKNIRFKANFIIVINNKNNSVYIDVSREGISKNTLLTLIQNLSFDLVNHVKLIGFFDDSDNPFEIYGKSVLLLEDERDELFEESFDTELYENNFFRKLVGSTRNENLSKFQLLSNSSLSQQVDSIENEYLKKLEIKQSNKNNIVIYIKNPFIFPIGEGFELGEFSKFNFRTKKPITDFILSRLSYVRKTDKIITRNEDLEGLNVIMSEQNKCYRKILSFFNQDYKISRKLKNIYKEATWEKIIKENNYTYNDEIKNLLLEHTKIKNKMSTLIDEPTRTKYSNRITIPRSIYKQKWNEEMEHFNQTKGKIKICGNLDTSILKSNFDKLLDFLFSERLERTQDDIYSNTEVMGGKFSKICEDMRELVKEQENKLVRTNLMHNLLFISRACYSLLYYSNIKLNKEDFMYDNLGYKNCLLIVKGGKKILSTKKTRLFSLIFPINEELVWLYSSQYTKVIRSEDNKLFCVLPWQNFFFPTVKKGIELYYTFSNYFLNSHLESNMTYELYIKFISCKVLNMFSQRRKLEIWFGSFRYLYLNSLSTHTSVLELIDSMVDFDYDPYFYLMQRLFASKYKLIYENAKDLKIFDIFTDTIFENFDLCAEKFDETIFMTMAPFDRDNEHMKNLRSVLETHDYFQSNFSMDPLTLLSQSSVNCNDDDFINKVFENDFKFDPKLNFCIGKFAGNYLKRLVSQETLAHEFTKIMQSSYTDISTSKGMRSSTGNFWGQKGHDVLFSNEFVQNEVQAFIDNQPKNNSEFRRKLDESEITFQDKIERMLQLKLEFDIKDKNQWKGSREIYVMSEKTKLLQQPLERFFKILCNWTPNELIHKKSHVRPKFIHSQVFEFESGDEAKTYCTLDCRKWAPRSNLWKYYYFILGMQNLLPKEFVDYFLQIWHAMFYKKVRIQERYAKKLENNSETKNLFNILEKRDDGDFEITMPYSFMMGIFNYLSSLLHAFSQLYFNEKIAQRQGAFFNLIAHSDDSGGVILSNSYEKNLLIFSQYEIFQKFCNHLLSKKKSSLSKHFFEIISIMYAKQRLIPMTHKFLGNVSFEPKGKGWVDDISTIVSKVVELFSNGASLSQCYLTMISMSEMIRKFYHLPRLIELSQLPLAFGGVFNMHPIHLILLGADAQEIMLDYLERSVDRSFRIMTYKAIGGDYFPGKGTQINYRIPYYKRHSFVLDLNEIEQSTLKLISSCVPKRTLGRKMQHYSQLQDSNYVYSLSGVDMCQIYTMTLFTPTFIMNSENKSSDLRPFARQYLAQRAINVIEVEDLNFPKSNFDHYMKASESVSIRMGDMSIRSNKTCKPITYNTFLNLGLNINYQTINELIAFNSKIDVKYILNDPYKLQVLTNWVKAHLPQSEHYDTIDFLMKISSKDMEKTRSSYCFLPSGVSVDTIERFWTYINFYSTRRYYISSKKPQYFTIDQFRLWNTDYDSIKHYYLILKIILNTEELTPKMIYKLKESYKCEKCLYNEAMKNMIEEAFQIRHMQEGEKLVVELPFATYQTKQYKSVNVWYGQSEFTLFTMFGDMKLSRDDSGQVLRVDLTSEEFLSQIWFLYKNFVTTRGIAESMPDYGVNDTADIKIGFNDLNQPILAPPGYKGMMVRNSLIIFSNSKVREIIKTDKKYTYNGENVDFEVYQNYDINPRFYEEHKLQELKEIIFEENLKVDQGTMLRNIRSTKLYKVLMKDEGHDSRLPFVDKYSREGLLGSSRSLTRALMLADSDGTTNYRSNINPIFTSQALLETQSYKDIPILDLVNKCSFARLTYQEKNVIEFALKRNYLTKEQEMIMDRIMNKLGLASTASAITIFKTVFANLSYKDVGKLNKHVVSDFILVMLKSAMMALEERPKSKKREKLKNTKVQIIKTLAFMININASNESIAQLLAKLFLRAHNDNPGVFWENRRDNIYCVLYKPSPKNLIDQTYFLFSCLNLLKKEKMLESAFNTRQLIMAKIQLKKKIESFLKRKKKKPSNFTSKVNVKDLNLRNYYLDEDREEFEDEIDLVLGGEDPENYIERTWDEDLDEEEFIVHNDLTLRIMQDETISNDYSSVEIKFLGDVIDTPWLGYGNFEEVVDKDDVIWKTATYPGTSKPEKYIFDFKGSSRIVSAANNIEIISEDEEESNRFTEPKERKVDKSKLMDFQDDEDAYQYQLEVLKNNGIPNPERFRKYFFRKSNFSDKDKFWATFSDSLNSKKEMKIKQVTATRKMRTAILPGFTGNLRDKVLKSELKCIFGDHVEEIISGNHRISQNVYKNVLMTIKRLFNSVNESEKAILVIILAVLKDCIIDDFNDSWLVDAIFGIINEIDDNLNSIDENLYIPPSILDTELSYEIVSEYEEYEEKKSDL